MSNGDLPLHLKPLSVYSHIVCMKQQIIANSPVCSIKVQISNDGTRGQKRRVSDSSLDEICETPLKRPRITRTCSQDLGYCSSGFLSGVQGSTPPQPPTITEDATPTRSKVNQPLPLVVSTPLSKCKQNHIDRDRESLPSPISVLKWDREVSSAEIKLCASLNFDACGSFALVGSQGTGEGEVGEVSQHDLISIHEPKSPESAVPLKGEVAESKVTDWSRNEESFDESTLPLQVQVKSKVVVVDNKQTTCKPVVMCSEEEWERNKKTYVGLVKRHMKERNGAANGVITELHSLMNSVAAQKTGRNDPHWQHPSDLTRKNFCKSRRKGPLLSLDEWQKRNHLTYRRFANVPDVFHRSPVL